MTTPPPITSRSTLAGAFAAVGNKGPGFDTLRLVAASAVMYHHASGVEHDIVHDNLFHFSQAYTQLGLFAVCVFFALSGFLVTPGLARSGDVIGYLSRRFMRIMPLLTVMVLLCALVIGPLLTSLPLREYFSDPLTWRYLKNVTTSLSLPLPGVVNHGGSNSVNAPMWTLRYEWLCYLAIAGGSLLGLLRRRYLFLAAYLGAMTLMLAGYGIIPTDEERGGPYMILFLFGYFGAGALIYLFGDLIPWSRGLVAAATAALGAVLYTGLGYVLAPILTTYVIVGLGLMRFPWSDLLARADLSYGIYLTHSVVLTVLANLYRFESGLLFFAACLPLSCLAAWLTWTFIEEPALRHKDLPARWARRILARLPVFGSRTART